MSTSSSTAAPFARTSPYQNLLLILEHHEGLQNLTQNMRNSLCHEIWKIAGRPHVKNFGEQHLFDSQPRLQQAVGRVAMNLLSSLDVEQKKIVTLDGILSSANRQSMDHQLDVLRIKHLLNNMHQLLHDYTPEIQSILDKWKSQESSSENKEVAVERIIQFLKTPDQTHLDLSGCHLINLPPILDLIPFQTRLKSMNLSENLLSSLPQEIFLLSHLKELDVSKNQLQSLPDQLSLLHKLKCLNASSNQLTAFPMPITELTELKILDLSNNAIAVLPEELSLLTNLAELYVNKNEIASLPQQLADLRRLKFLNLCDNQLSVLPDEIFELRNLRGLDLSHNSLRSLSLRIGQLVELKQLGLARNQLSSLPQEFTRLFKLEELNLCHNQFSTFPEQILPLFNLKILNLSENQIKQITDQLSQLINLEQLNLSNNHIEIVPNEIGYLLNLQYLHLSGNRLTSLPEATKHLQPMLEFSLSDNPDLRDIPSVLFQLTQLCRVHIERTGIPSFELEKLQKRMSSQYYSGPVFVISPSMDT